MMIPVLFFLLVVIILLQPACVIAEIKKLAQKRRKISLTPTVEINQYTFNDFALMYQQNEDLVDIYNELGQSIAALNIQLQVAQKLWQSNPTQAKESVCEAYHLSGDIMREVREKVRILNQNHCNHLENSQLRTM